MYADGVEMKMVKGWLFKLLAMLVFIVALLAAADNSEEVSLSFLEYSTPPWPISYWILTAFVFGVLFSSMMNTWTNTQLRLAARKAKTQVAQTNKDLDQEKAKDSAKVIDGVKGEKVG